MFCGRCGLKLEENQMQCPRCGKYVPGAVPPPEPVTPPEPVVPPTPVQPPVPVPPPFPAPQPGAPKKKNKGLLIAVIALVVLAVGAVGFLTGMLIYHNSDGYKIGQAETAVLDGNADEALDRIRDVASPEADAVRQFCEIEKQRKAFFENYDKTVLQGFDAPVKVSYDKLSEVYNSFKAADKLPEKLRERYDRYNSRIGDMNTVLSGLSTRTLTDAQRCVLSFGERKRGSNFTPNELRAVIEQNEPAVTALQTGVVNNKAYAAFAEKNDAAAVRAMNEFCQTAIERLEQDKFDLANYISRYDADTTMLLSDKDANYVASMTDLLSPLTSLDDAQSNAQLLYTAMCYAWTAYAYGNAD